MIVWINGAFGVGKTSVARKLVRRLRNAIVFDPEILGGALQRLRFGRAGDFQDLPSWRRWTVRCLKLASMGRSTLVTPMTLVNRAYFDEIVGVLRRDHDVRHFALLAPRETVLDRLRQRGEGSGAWGEMHIDRCVEALSSAAFAEHVGTEGRSVDEVVEDLLARLGD